jgi:pimeloyl-ACP methyl ester carboxylesterase
MPVSAGNGGFVLTTSRGFRIRYEVFGNGPAVALLHGFPMWGDRWTDTGYVAELESRYQVIVPDLIGHGQSDKPHEPAAYGSVNMAADVLAVLDAAGVDRAHVWGYSMGTTVAEKMAVSAPRRVLSLVLGGFPPGLDREQWRADRGSERPQTWDDLLGGWPPPVYEMFRSHNHDLEALLACEAMIGKYPTTLADLRSAPHPTLAYCGADDDRVDLARQQCDALPCRLEIVPGGHALAFRQAENILPLAIKHLEASGTAAG